MPFLEIIEILALWFCISVPMVFLGAYFGYRKPLEPYPVATSNIPRQVKVYFDTNMLHLKSLKVVVVEFNMVDIPMLR